MTTQSFLLMFWMNSFQLALARHLLAAKSWDSELKALPACLRAEWDPESPALFLLGPAQAAGAVPPQGARLLFW